MVELLISCVVQQNPRQREYRSEVAKDIKEGEEKERQATKPKYPPLPRLKKRMNGGIGKKREGERVEKRVDETTS